MNMKGTIVMLLLIPVILQAAGDIPVLQSLDVYENNILDSGGPLLSDQAAYNVYFYDLDLFVDPHDSTIHGSVIVHAHVREEMKRFVVHLDTIFRTERVLWLQSESHHELLDYSHDKGLIIAELSEKAHPGDRLMIEITYNGQPRTAPNPPWEGGFTWAQTDIGEPWVGVSCQVNGADIWWPVKDHPSDRPDSVSLKITVPDGLTAVSNGVLRSEKSYSDGTRTFHWVTNSPISNYAVTMNIGPYSELVRSYESVSGDIFPIHFWSLPENYHKAVELMDQIEEHMGFFEELLGPYPFLREKYGVVEAPFLGMEHQTLIAYGAGYKNDVVFETDSGFDDLHHHELAHEWWGNHVVAYDWKDFWIHEGFGTYMQPLFAEKLHGPEQYRYFMKKLYSRIENNIPIAPTGVKSTREMFEGRDIYMKGSWVLHTLRKMIGDELFFDTLRYMIRPDQNQNKNTPLEPGRFVDTQDYIDIVESLTGENMDWFFDAYLRHADLPELRKRWEGDLIYLSWKVPSGNPFPMPVEIYDGKERKLIIPQPNEAISVHDRSNFVVDPDNRVLRAGMYRYAKR